MCLKIAVWVAISVDPDETPCSAASHLGLHCLLRPVCPNTVGKYGNYLETDSRNNYLGLGCLKTSFTRTQPLTRLNLDAAQNYNYVLVPVGFSTSLVTYCWSTLQRQHLLRNMLPLKRIFCFERYLMSRMCVRKALCYFYFLTKHMFFYICKNRLCEAILTNIESMFLNILKHFFLHNFLLTVT